MKNINTTTHDKHNIHYKHNYWNNITRKEKYIDNYNSKRKKRTTKTFNK